MREGCTLPSHYSILAAKPGSSRNYLKLKNISLNPQRQIMGVPLIQQYRVGRYILGKKFSGVKRYPLVLMLEPLFRCNLACAGCGKIDYPEEILDKRLSKEDCLSAVIFEFIIQQQRLGK